MEKKSYTNLFFKNTIKILQYSKIKNLNVKFLVFFFLSILNFLFDLFSIFSIFPLVILILDKNKFYQYIEKFDVLNFVDKILYNELMIILILFIFLLTLAKLFVVSYFQFYKNRLFTNIQINLSRNLLQMYLKIPYKIIITKPTGKIITNIKNECERINYNLKCCVDFFFEFLILLTIFFLILLINFTISTTIIISLTLVSILFTKFIRKYILNIGSVRSKNMAFLTRYLLQVFNGIKTVKISNTINEVTNIFLNFDQKVGWQDTKSNTFQIFPRLFFEFIFIFSMLLLIVIAIFLFESQENLIALLTVSTLCAYRVLPAFSRMHVYFQGIKFTENSISNILNEIREGQDLKEKKHPFKFEKLRATNLLSANSVFFFYAENQKNIIENVNFSIKKGEKIAIIGDTGSGKSTLLDIILGLHKPNQGNVVLNISYIKNFRELSEFFSYVPQQPFLIDGTILENITFGNKHSMTLDRQKDLISSLEMSCSNEFIMKLEDGINTHIGENGIRLSLGQRQRINLARALYGKSKLLIMDEPTSALDPKIEKKIISNLCNFYQDLAIIIVTHKYDILNNFDSIYRLDKKSLKKIIKPFKFSK